MNLVIAALVVLVWLGASAFIFWHDDPDMVAALRWVK